MNRLETRSCEPSAPGGSGGRQGRLTDARLPAAPRARTRNDPEQVSVTRNGENLRRKLPPAPARTRRVSTRFPARRTVIVTRSRDEAGADDGEGRCGADLESWSYARGGDARRKSGERGDEQDQARASHYV